MGCRQCVHLCLRLTHPRWDGGESMGRRDGVEWRCLRGRLRGTAPSHVWSLEKQPARICARQIRAGSVLRKYGGLRRHYERRA